MEEEKKDFKPTMKPESSVCNWQKDLSPYQEDLSLIGVVVFVNHISETVEVAKNLLHNTHLDLLREIDKPFLVTIMQMCGSGKTMMDKNAIPRARALYTQSAEWQQINC